MELHQPILLQSIAFCTHLKGAYVSSGYSGNVVEVEVSIVFDSETSDVKSIQSVDASCVELGVLVKWGSSTSLSDCAKFRCGSHFFFLFLPVHSSFCSFPLPSFSLSLHICSSCSIPKSNWKSLTSSFSSPFSPYVEELEVSSSSS